MEKDLQQVDEKGHTHIEKAREQDPCVTIAHDEGTRFCLP